MATSRRRALAFAVCMASLACGCASSPSNAPTVADDQTQSCRDFMIPGVETTQRACGNNEEWAELDRRLAMLDGRLECRELLGRGTNPVSTRCLTAEEWAEYERIERAAERRQVEIYQGSSYGGF